MAILVPEVRLPVDIPKSFAEVCALSLKPKTRITSNKNNVCFFKPLLYGNWVVVVFIS
jgi:hypothetical protein